MMYLNGETSPSSAVIKDAPSRNRILGTRVWFLSISILLTQWASLTSFYSGRTLLVPLESKKESELPSSNKPCIFNPFRDLTLGSTNAGNGSLYSAHRCVEPSESPFAPFVSRTCLFSNLYFQYSDKTFHYYASPAESAAFTKQELEERLTMAKGYVHNEFLERAQLEGNDLSQEWKLQFTPVIHHNKTIPASGMIRAVKTPENPIFVLYLPSYSFNFGHFLWDDALGIFTMLDFFGYSQIDQEASETSRHQPIPVHMDQGDDPFFRCSHEYRWDLCFKMLRKIMPKLLGIHTDTTGNDERGDILRVGNLFEPFYNGTASSESELVLLPKLIAGPGRNSHFGCKGECTIQRPGRVYKFRFWLFQNIFGFEQGKYQHHKAASSQKITISLPIGNTHSPEEIETFEEIVPALNARFGRENVHAVDMAKLTIEEQASLTASSKVYLSNNGGGSATSFFLQKGSSVLLFHTEEQKRDLELYSTVGYLNVNWVPVNASIDTVMNLVERALVQPAD